MRRRSTKVQTITVFTGTELRSGNKAEVQVDDTFKATLMTHPNAPRNEGEAAFRIGDGVNVFRLGKLIGRFGLEPFMIVRNGAIGSLGGESEVQLPVLLEGAQVY